MSEVINTQEYKHNPKYDADYCSMEISNLWLKWNTAKIEWMESRKELRNYLFATDTRGTTNSKLPWKNSTVTPKLTQIRDNLHANYMAALFPSDDWFVWEASEKDEKANIKKDAIMGYMKNKIKASGFDLTVSQLVLDYVDYGNVFVGHEYVNLTKKDPQTGEEIVMYRGPRAFRINPIDVCFDPTAPSFDRSPLIIRTLKSVGDIVKDIQTKPNLGYDPEVVQKIVDCRNQQNTDLQEQIKSSGLVVDGFSNIEQYLQSNMVEVLEFYGDFYDISTNTLYQDNIITVVDRKWVLRKAENPSWLGTRPIFHCGWRLKPDNLWAQGPLDQLVGMQYRIDHLENLRADVFDQIAHPIAVIMGDTVEDFEFAPGVQIHCGAEGKIEFARPDGTALQAELQIDVLMQKMEDLAGAPKQAMGIRTPGEKTKYEVQVLENGAGRIFQSKANWFEKNIIEPLLNSMLEESVRNLDTADTIRTVDPELGVEEFVDISKEDIKAKGKLYPMGARHFAEQAKFVQELTQTLQLIEQIPAIKPHISGLATAKALEENLGWRKYGIVKKDIAVSENADTQRLINQAGENVETEATLPSEPTSEDIVAGGPPDAESANPLPT